MLLAQTQQVVEATGSNTTLLGFILSGALGVAVTTGYRFVVNFRKTERGMSRARIRQANANERAAQHEASLWQNRAADLEYQLRRHGFAVPPLSEELAKLVQDEAETLRGEQEAETEDPTGGRPAP